MQFDEMKDEGNVSDGCFKGHLSQNELGLGTEKACSSSSIEVQAGDIEENVAGMEQGISYDLLGNNLEGLDDFSPGDADKFSKSFSGRRHAIGNTEDKSFSLIEGMFANQIEDGIDKTSCGDAGIRSADAIAGTCGLSNIGNTCYMNSGLQCLFATPSMVHHFCATKEDENESTSLKHEMSDQHMENKYISLSVQDSNKNDVSQENLDSQLPLPNVSSLPLIEGKKEDDSLIGCDYQILKSDEHQPLQDLCATKSEGMLKEQSQEFEEKIPQIKTMFGSLLEQIWSGEWSSLRPTQFKDTLEIFHPQFRGAHQQDCQEFLALLLDTLHEELRAEREFTRADSFSRRDIAIDQESKDMSLAIKTRGRKFSGTVGPTDDKKFGLCTEPYADQFQPKATDLAMVSSNSKTISITDSSTNIMSLKCKTTFSTNCEQGAVKNNMDFKSEKCDADAIGKQQQAKQSNEVPQDCQTETKEDIDAAACSNSDVYDIIRGSENPSPKSFDSQYSVEDKVTSAIRRLPIPNSMKCENLTFDSSEDGLSKEVQRYIGRKFQNNCIEYGDISDNSTRDNDEMYTIDSQTTSRNSPSVMNETSNDSDIGNDCFPTSNLLPQEHLHKYRSKSQSREIDVVQEVADIKNNIQEGYKGHSSSYMQSISEYYQKENKTLNVNVLADENNEMNNEISFDSKKFSIPKLEKMRPQETIDNLNEFAPEDSEDSNLDPKNLVHTNENNQFHYKNSEKPIQAAKCFANLGKQKHTKKTNLYTNEKSNPYGACSTMIINDSKDMSYYEKMNDKGIKNYEVERKQNQDALNSSFDTCDFTEIKRIRLDSAETEKNVKIAMEREKQKEISRPDICLSKTKPCPNEPSEMIEDDEGQSSSSQHQTSEVLSASSEMENSNSSFLKESAEADRCWDQYLAENDTIVARTFQGQFKNTVVCSVCNFVSVSFEPFMYLPVPLPNAHIRQVEITFISGINDQKPVMFLIELTHADSVIDLKKKLLSFLSQSDKSADQNVFRSQSDSKMQVVEVLDHHVSRTVDDWVSLNHLKDSVGLNSGSLFENSTGSQSRKIYLMEILALDIEDKPEIEDESSTLLITTDQLANSSSKEESGVIDIEEYKSCMICMEDLPTDQLRQHNACDCIMCNPCLERTIEHSYTAQTCNQEDNEMETLLLGSEVSEYMNVEDPSNALFGISTASSLPQTSTNSKIHSKIKCPGCMNDADVDSDFARVELDQDIRTCVICMDDFAPEELFQHRTKLKRLSGDVEDQVNRCNAPMCEPCLRRTAEHHRQIKCPGCRQDANPCVEFVALNEIGKSKPKLRSLCLPVVFRLDNMEACDNNRKFITLFGHPGLVNVPNQVTGHQLNQLIRHLMPSALLCQASQDQELDLDTYEGTKGQTDPCEARKSFRFVMVNAQGKLCSRCIWNSHCYGCIRLDPEDDKTKVLLQPSDTIAISFTDITTQEINEANTSHQHSSMSLPRVKERLKLDDDCISAFSQSETLDEANPWYCPECRKNQCATKTLTVWRFPDFLILYLKRFIFMGNDGTCEEGNSSIQPGGTAIKLNKDVEFKVSGLDLTKYLSGPLNDSGPRNEPGCIIDQKKKPIFNLYGCVCHFGSIHGGHYTSYAKHLATGQWNYFDDCTVTEKKIPGFGGNTSGDYSSAYILFYQRAGTNISGSFSTNLPTISQFGGMNIMEDPVENRNLRLDRLTSFHPKVPENTSPDVENKFVMKSRNNSNDKSTTNPILNKIDDEDTNEQSADIAMIVETEEVHHQPDLSEIIRSLDTPPPS